MIGHVGNYSFSTDTEETPRPQPFVRSWPPALFCFAALALARIAPLPGADGKIAHLPDVCLFHRVTGLPCPACGITRSIVCLMHGRLAESWTYHPLGLAVAAALLLAGLLDMARWLGVDTHRVQSPTRASAAVPYAGLALVLLVWAARLAGWDALPR